MNMIWSQFGRARTKARKNVEGPRKGEGQEDRGTKVKVKKGLLARVKGDQAVKSRVALKTTTFEHVT
jgi:hypothetical protein